jgi:hypothetical protein
VIEERVLYQFLFHRRCRENRNFLDTLYWQVDECRNGSERLGAVLRVIGDPKSWLGVALQRLESNLGLRRIERATPLRAYRRLPSPVE